ncbi:MAG TPA: insulinase family protein [Bacteroidetes bacterium]|nr:insulinase family protein [Bacteroidota bacterium]
MPHYQGFGGLITSQLITNHCTTSIKIFKMKNKILFLFIAILALPFAATSQEDFRKTAPAPGPAPKIELGQANQITFASGLKVIVVENHKLPVVSMQMFVDIPPILEGPSAGYVSMAGEMLSKGTTTRSKADIDEAVDFIGASLSTSANGVRGRCLSKHKEKLLDIMADVLFNPTFPEEEFEKLKKQNLSGLAQAKDDPNAMAANVSKRVRNGKNHPYGEVETEETISNIKLEECKNFYKTYFQPGISYLIITGDVQKQEAFDLASKYFSKWENTPIKLVTYDTPEKPEATTVAFADKPGAVQSVINITYPVDLKPNSPDNIKANVMNTLLGRYSGSRLNMNIREDKGYTYGARSSLNNDPVIGSFTAFASVRNEVTDSSIVEFLKEINKLRNEEVSEEELTRVKNYMTGSFARALENPATVARFTLNTARFGLPKDYYATYLEKLSKVTAKDVQQMARKYLTTDQAYIVVVGNKDEVAKKLLPFSKQGRINYYDAFGNIIEEVSMPVPSGVTAETVLSDYLNAVGGMDKLNKIENVVIVMEAEVQGMKIESTLYHMAPNKLSTLTKMMGNIVQQSTFDGTKGVSIAMGQSEPMKGKDLENMKIDGHLFPERFYKDLGVKTELKGIELVNGKKAYRIEIVYPSGTKKTNYFDMESSLKVKEIEHKGEALITNEIGDYQEVDGIQFPHSITVNGAMPIPLVLKTTALEVNAGIGDDLFKIND